jgi:hypothetical protein
MKKILLSAALIAASFTTFAQVGVGTTTPKGALQVTSTTSGVIIPQFADLTAIQAIKKADGTTAIDTEEQGMQVYNIAESKIYMWTGTAWVAGATGSTAKFVDGDASTQAVYNDGKVGIGTTNPDWLLHLVGDESTTAGQGILQLDYARDANARAIITFRKSRGTAIAPTLPHNGDKMGSITFEAFGTADYYPGASIYGAVDTANPFSTTNRGSKLGFQTANDGEGTREERLTIRNNGAIGVGNEDPKALLDVNGYVKLGSVDAIADAALEAGMVRYNTELEVYNGTSWGSSWSTSGNSGTTAGTDFIGTTDAIDLVFKTNNTFSGLISTFSVGIGYRTLGEGLSTGTQNSAFGTRSLFANTTGAYNTALGYNAIGLNATGNFNTSVGRSSLSSMTSGDENSSLGASSLLQLATGSDNTSIGGSSLFNLASGDKNTAIGYKAGTTLTSGSNNIFIGYLARPEDVTGSNQLNIGNVIFGKDLTGTVGVPAGNIGIGVSNPTEKLQVDGAITIGDTATVTPPLGTIKFDGTNFFGYTSTGWVQLDN